MAHHWLISTFEARFRQIVAVARRRGATLEAAEDIAQEAILRLLQARTPELRHPSAYLFRTAHNLHRDIDRRHRGAPFVSLPDEATGSLADPRPSAERDLMARDDLRRLRAIIDGLPRRQREILTLSRLEGLDNPTIAARLGITQNMVERHLRLGLARCIDLFMAS